MGPTPKWTEKRISRAKKVLAGSKTLFDIRGTADFTARLSAVQRALYLLFNEGYHGACSESAIRLELCRESTRLTTLLLEHPLASTPATYAPAALMRLHAARLPARLDESGDLNSFGDQDRSQWDRTLLVEGVRLLERSATGDNLTESHVEAAIAAVHADADRVADTNWGRIVGLCDTLLAIRPSPVIALNRAIAAAEHEGPERGLEAVHAIVDLDRLAAYPFYSATLGELELRRGRLDAAGVHFRAALALARNPTERRFLEQRVRRTTSGQEPGCDVGPHPPTPLARKRKRPTSGRRRT